jgi:predicted amidohydrolase
VEHTLSLAAAQTVPVGGDVDANIDRHLRIVRVAAERGARVLVFPELSLTGYEPDHAADLAFTLRDVRLAPLVAAASRDGMTLIVGAPVRLNGRLHIGAFVLGPTRPPILYTKHHLGEGEGAVFSAGDRDPLIDVDGMPMSVAVCADANHPSHPADAASRGAEVYLVSTLITLDEFEHKSGYLRAYAARHAMPVVFANYGGPSGGLDAGGRSAIWSESGALLVQLDGPGPGFVFARRERKGWFAEAVPLDHP